MEPKANVLEKDVPYASLPELVDDAARKFGERSLWLSIDDGTRISFSEFASQTLKCANALRACGVQPGTHVAVMLPNVPAYAMTWMALARIGAVMVPVNTQYKERELEYVLRDSDSAFLVIDESCLEAFNAIENRHQLISSGSVLVHGAADEERALSWRRAVSEAPATLLDVRGVNADTLMSIQYTSGSTGLSKGCMLTQDYWLVLGYVRAHQGPPPKRVMIDKPLSYMGGMWRFLVSLYVGATACVARRFSLSGLQQRLIDHQIDFFAASDAVAKLPDLPGIEKLNIAWISCAGLSKGLHKALEEKFRAPVRELYGLTETGSTLYMPTGAGDMSGSASCGLPAPHRKCRIVGPDGNDVPRGTIGELWVSGRGILKGYYNKPDATREAFSGDWFRTGDLFRQDESGYFYIQGRIKDSIRRSGENISAREIESVAAGVEGVLETAAVAVPDEVRGEEVKLCVVLQHGVSSEQVTPNHVIAYCQSKLAAFKVPRYIEYLDDFPRTSSGKIAKQQLTGKGPARKVFDRVTQAWC